MTEKINNICWEFCYEYIPANLDNKGEPQLLVLNLPSSFKKEIESRLLDYNFYCSKKIPHGNNGMIMQFKKVGFAIEN